MKNTLVVLLFLGLILSCGVDDNNGCNPEMITTTLFPDREVIIDTVTGTDRLFFEMVAGDKTVFEYNLYGPDCENVIDDEYGEAILFSVDNDRASFSMEGDELKENDVLYRQYGAWFNTLNYIDSGFIRGDQTRYGTWNIEISITTPEITAGGTTKSIDYTYSIQE